MTKITMMTAMMVGCLCVGAAMAEPEQKKPDAKGPRMERRENREGRGMRIGPEANRFGGKVVAKDGATVTVKNRAEKEMTFTAKGDEAKKMLEGIAVGDRVGVRFAKDGEAFTLDGIRKMEARPDRPEGAPGERRMRQAGKDKPAGEGKDKVKEGGKDKPAGEGKDKIKGDKKAACEGCPMAKEKAAKKEKAKDKAE